MCPCGILLSHCLSVKAFAQQEADCLQAQATASFHFCWGRHCVFGPTNKSSYRKTSPRGEVSFPVQIPDVLKSKFHVFTVNSRWFLMPLVAKRTRSYKTHTLPLRCPLWSIWSGSFNKSYRSVWGSVSCQRIFRHVRGRGLDRTPISGRPRCPRATDAPASTLWRDINTSDQ